jgi:hypothetical protein
MQPSSGRSFPAAGAVSLLFALLVVSASRAEVAFHGFLEGAIGGRVTGVDAPSDFTLEETRAQFRLDTYGEVGEAVLRVDAVHDAVVGDDTEVELREAFLRFTTLGEIISLKVGRQAATWGTGDLVFVNDLFPKDWRSFFAGRDLAYLKAPADVLRLGIFGLPLDLDLAITPQFTPDRLPEPGRFPGAGPGEEIVVLEPSRKVENAELAVRLSRYVGSSEVAFYGYRGFWKTPAGLGTDPATGMPALRYPDLAVVGASARGTLGANVVALEGGFYHSREDAEGDDPLVPNSELRGLVRVDRQLTGDLGVGIQAYLEARLEQDAYESTLPAGAEAAHEVRQVYTVRVDRTAYYETLRLSLFAFVSPTDEDAHLRLSVTYRFSDEVSATLGGLVFEGDDPTTFGAMDDHDSVYLRLRHEF